MNLRHLLGMNGDSPDVAYEVDIPPEMTQGMTAGGMIAPKISKKEALQVPAVLRSRNLIAGTLARLPIHVRNKEREIVDPTSFLNQINPDLPNVVTFARTYEDLLFESVSWWMVTAFGYRSFPMNAEHVDTTRVGVVNERVYIDGYPVPDNMVIRFDSPNPPLLTHAARAIRTCLLLDDTAADYATTPVPLGAFTPRQGMKPREDPKRIEDLLNSWEAMRKRHRWGYIGAAWELHQMSFNAEQIQLADQRQHAVLEIARAAGIDPEDLGVSTTSRTYQNSEQRRQDLIDFTLAPYSAAIEQRLSMNDVLPRGYEAKINFDGFLRADTKTRFEAHKIALESQFETVEEVRELEDRPELRQTTPVLTPIPSEQEA
jgi:hypothetical protein